MARYFGGSFWRIDLAGHFGAFIWRVFMAKKQASFKAKKRQIKRKEKSVQSVGRHWGSGLKDLATESLIDAVGYHLVPMYRVIGPMVAVALLVLFLVGIQSMLLDIVVRAIAIARIRSC
jgi:hypothetical protein